MEITEQDKKVLEELGLSNVSDAQKEAVLNMIDERLEKRFIANLLVDLPEGKQKELQDKVEQMENSEPEKVIEAAIDLHPDAKGVLEKSAKEIIEEFKADGQIAKGEEGVEVPGGKIESRTETEDKIEQTPQAPVEDDKSDLRAPADESLNNPGTSAPLEMSETTDESASPAAAPETPAPDVQAPVAPVIEPPKPETVGPEPEPEPKIPDTQNSPDAQGTKSNEQAPGPVSTPEPDYYQPTQTPAPVETSNAHQTKTDETPAPDTTEPAQRQESAAPIAQQQSPSVAATPDTAPPAVSPPNAE